VPFGWFAVAWSADIVEGELRPIRAFARELVLWRTEAGDAQVHDAFCPHLGAHLAHGGRVAGQELVCPFHGWQFDVDGHNTCIPYSERTNGRARLRSYPVLERNGLVMAWYHPDDLAPLWDIPEVAEFAVDVADFAPPTNRFFEIATAWQEMAENGVDSAHFRYVHGTAELPVLERYEPDAHQSHMRSKQFFVTPRGTVEGRIDTDAHGPGFSVVRFSGIIDTVLLGCATPIDRDHCEMRFTFTVRKFADARATSAVGEAAIDEISRQLLEDRPIWEHKVFIDRPALADTDGPFMQFRQWAAQFYVDDRS
jgi:phenylpropionate dioxygenase-like ring-hydroxylating dioxygenase large terminal subunit